MAAQAEHAYYCFDVLAAKLNKTSVPVAQFDPSPEYPLFVTWNIASRSSGSKRLRGCIGNFEAMPIGDGLREYAIIRDHRFDPITLKELPRLECGISLLTDFELCNSHLDWDLETHGIYIQLPNPALGPLPPATPGLITSLPGSTATSASSLSLPDGAGSRRPTYTSISRLPKFQTPKLANPRKLPAVLTATYLPDVATAQGWTKTEAIDSCIQKAGYSGKITDEIRASLRLTRYQSKKTTKTYDEWREWREGT
ncbi:hypothetical protein OIV83_006206 [Microbotryomycetes sp. JL201]|nr:hypothetical protein OIV83_006206 [Microbotryomycetes sp. JL201]